MKHANDNKPHQLAFDFVASNDNEKPINELEAKFLQFHENNPHVYQKLEALALKAIAVGFKHYAIKTLLENIRWHVDMTTTDGRFKISNNHAPYYARLFHKLNPEHSGFFITHKVKGEAA